MVEAVSPDTIERLGASVPMSTRGRAVLLAAVALAVVLGVVLVYTLTPSGPGGRGGSAADLPTSTSPRVPDPTARASGASPSERANPTPPPSSPGPSAAATTPTATTGPGLTEAGIHVVAQAAADGSLEVVEQILLARPVSVIGLAAPVTPAYPGLEGLSPEVVGLQAESRGVPIAVALSDPLLTREELRFGPTTSLSLRYHLDRATRRTEPSTLGRALTVLPAITAGDYPDLPVVIEVVGPGVRNVLCTHLPGDQQFCAVQAGQTWTTAALTGRPVAVIAQLDLPAPG
ncbi:MAG: hypothetical protein ABI083_13975 [Lapillicoccus sp.]